VLLHYGTNRRCPYCDSSDTLLAGRKNHVLQLRKCSTCGLRFRWPKDTAGFSEKYYQKSYKESGFTTDLPSRTLLDEYIATGFAGSPKDFSRSIEVLQKLLPSGRILDFGCSWGYGAYQLKQAGYDAIGFEISKPRAELGRRELHVEVIDSQAGLDQLPDESFDGIYASHVLEHILSLKGVFSFFARVLKPNGIAMLLVPNSGGKEARELGTGWGPMIGEKHLLALDGEFFLANLPAFGFRVLALSNPYNPTQIEQALSQNTPLSQDGEELMVIARKL